MFYEEQIVKQDNTRLTSRSILFSLDPTGLHLLPLLRMDSAESTAAACNALKMGGQTGTKRSWEIYKRSKEVGFGPEVYMKMKERDLETAVQNRS